MFHRNRCVFGGPGVVGEYGQSRYASCRSTEPSEEQPCLRMVWLWELSERSKRAMVDVVRFRRLRMELRLAARARIFECGSALEFRSNRIWTSAQRST